MTFIQQIKQACIDKNIAVGDISIGVMIEVPSLALSAHLIAPIVDFSLSEPMILFNILWQRIVPSYLIMILQIHITLLSFHLSIMFQREHINITYL